MSQQTQKTSSVYTRIDPSTKQKAEAILDELGIPMSNAIGMFLKQIVLHNGIPFPVQLPSKQPVVISDLSKEEFDSEMEKGFEDTEKGKTVSLSDVKRDMRSLYGL